MFRRVFLLAKPFWRDLAVIAVIILTISGIKQIEPIIFRQITDTIVDAPVASPYLSIPSLLALLLGARLLISFLNRVSWYFTSLTTERFSAHLRQVGFEHLMTLSLSFFHASVSGKTMSQLDRGVNRITNVISNSGMYFIPNVVTAIISVTIVMSYSVPLGIAAITSFLPFSLIHWWRFKRNEKLEKREQKLYDKQYAHFWEAISSMELVKSFMAENFEARRLRHFHQKLINIRRRMEINNNYGLSGDLILDAWMWGLFAYIVFLAYQGSITIGTMVLLIGYVQLIREPLWSLNWIYWEVRRAQIGAREYFEILNAVPEITDPVDPVKLDLVKGRITFDQVSFGYNSGKKVLENISFTIKPGEMVALVGPSGSGKTTIASLLVRFFDPTSGKILLDGIDIKNLTARNLRHNIGVVMQEAQLFADTIEENLRYGKPNATQKEFEQAARTANAHEFIKDLQHGYKTEIGERGIQLSGGQRQRLSIARTIIKNPPIIVLDEATSSLDSHSELLIQQSLETLLSGRTSIIIAHRLSTVAKADKIIVLKDRHIFEQGSHQELLAKKGLYASLFDIQSGKIKRLQEWDLVE